MKINNKKKFHFIKYFNFNCYKYLFNRIWNNKYKKIHKLNKISNQNKIKTIMIQKLRLMIKNEINKYYYSNLESNLKM